MRKWTEIPFRRVAIAAWFLSCFALFCHSSLGQDQNWDGRFGLQNDELEGGNPTTVNAIAAAGTNVYVAGDFTSAGGISASNIARWDGHSWHALGDGPANGLEGRPWAIAVSPSGQVYVGGYFSHAGGLAVNSIARWDGTNWFPLGSGVDNSAGEVLALAFDTNGNLYAGGSFTSIGGTAVNSLARWDGTNWWDVGGGVASGVGGVPTAKTLLIQGTNIYVGGYFDRVGGANWIYAGGVAVWNGSTWASVGSTPNSAYGTVNSMISDGTNLYVCGEFTELGGINVTNLARWDGRNWSAVGPGIPSYLPDNPSAVQLNALALFKNEIIVGGNFTDLGGQNIEALGRWMDGQWWPLGSGLAGNAPYVNTLAISSAGLFVGGSFSQAGGQSANGFALWNLNNELPAVQFIAPTNGSVFNGYQMITLSANAASANGPITAVQFLADGNSLGTVTNPPSTMEWSNMTSGLHTLVATATDATGAEGSATEAVTVNLPLNGPIITGQPRSQTLTNGNTVTLTVQATGNGALSYQWFRDGTAVAGATNFSLVYTNAGLADSAVYTVQVSDSVGATLSSRAPVSVLQPIAPLWVQSDAGNSAPAVGGGGLVYIGSPSMVLSCIAANSAYQWGYVTTRDAYASLPTSPSPALGTNGLIFYGSADGSLYCFNADGSVRWTNSIGRPGVCSAIGSDGTVYVGSMESNFDAIAPDGSNEWSFKTGGIVWSAPAISTNGTVYFATDNSNLFAVSPAGAGEWTFPANAPFYEYNSPVIGGDGSIYITCAGTNFYALNPDGTVKWIFTAAGPFHCSPVIGPDGTIYVGNDGAYDPVQGSTPGKLYALAPDGSEEWEFTAAAPIRSSPAVAQDGTIYFGSDDDNVYALNPDGTERWQLRADSPVESSPAIRFDGVVYVGAGSSLYALPGTSALASSPWPMYQHDLQHTGNAATGLSGGWDYPFKSNQFDGQVNAMAASGNDIFVGGDFHLAGGVAANHVAEWDGTHWIALGDGVNGDVNAIAISGGVVYVSQEMENQSYGAGTYWPSNAAFWDGSQWHAMGNGGSNIVQGIVAGTNGIYAGISTTNALGAPLYYVAKWDGTNWLAVGDSLNGPVENLAVDGGDIYVGIANPFSVEEWNGSQWSLLGSLWSDSGNQPIALAAANGVLYAGGPFYKVNNTMANGIAEWTGNQWLPLGTGISDPITASVNAIALDGTNVYAGGSFTAAGGVSVNGIARWDDAQWHAMGEFDGVPASSFGASVEALCLAGGQVYAGGAFDFSSAGSSDFLQVWNGTHWSALGPKVGFVDGAFHLFLTDQLGRSYGVEASTDLVHWARIMTFTNLGGATEFIDPASSNLTSRYYRIVVP